MNSKELLEKTGISRATLNNYISWGIVPKPDVLPPGPDDGAAPRIGYFPDEVAQRIEEIQRLKREGWSITRIAEHFGGKPASAAAGDRKPAGVSGAVPGAKRGTMPDLSLDEIANPAYIVNHRFEVIWFNAAASAGVLRGIAQSPMDLGSRNVFKYLLQGPDAASREQMLRFYLGLARQHGAGPALLCRDVPEDEAGRLVRLHEEAKPPEPGMVSHALLAGDGTAGSPLCLYAVQFREGILVLHVPGNRAAQDASQPAGQSVPAAPPAKVEPKLTRAAVLASDLQHPNRIWSELPAEEYFELINHIWLTVEPIFRRHHGTHGKHHRDGLVCYFLPQRDGSHVWNALLAAIEMREAMRRVSKAWQLRKGWTTELYMNTGLDEGPQWLGALKSPPQAEFTMLGDTLNNAVRISDFASFGAIWATKNLIGKLTPEEKPRLKYGVRRRSNDGRDVFVASLFSNVDSLTDPAGGPVEKLKCIARLPITEIVELVATGTQREIAPEPIRS
ncbi:MAG: adenylate/guanylate cyclase domain-containing protein [Ramlibacter sp.]|nr:adenylate/guanylate cyclase domain-containing protein [Ramlibacter sp.]